MFYKDGFIKKFPLEKEITTIGRGNGNDLVLSEDYVSRNHAKIVKQGKDFILHDLDSRNCTCVDGTPISNKILAISDCFTIKDLEFYLKKGDIKEFEADKRLVPIFNKIATDNRKPPIPTDTKYIRNIYQEILKRILHQGLRGKSVSGIFSEITPLLASQKEFGSLFFLTGNQSEWSIAYFFKKQEKALAILREILKKHDVFKEINSDLPREAKEKPNFLCLSFPWSKDEKGALVYLLEDQNRKEILKIKDFLATLVKVLELIALIVPGKENKVRNYDPDEEIPQPEFIITQNPAVMNLIKQTKKIAAADIFILVQGESGTGKELFTRLIHDHSRRRTQPFIAINCAAIPETLLESELFGHEKGAFTGAFQSKIGKLQLASGGTLVLDEISEMTVNLQTKLLRALEEHEFFRLGGNTSIRVNLRIISLTNANLKKQINENKFREDLYYRLVHHTISLPPLRERKEDILPLTFHFAEQFCKKSNRQVRGFSLKTVELLQDYPWPGNIRQLRNEINRLVNLVDDGQLITDDLISDEIKSTFLVKTNSSENLPEGGKRAREIQDVTQLLEKNQWNQTQTAKEIGITFQGLYKKLKRLGISKPQPNGKTEALEITSMVRKKLE
jgi:Nif-specific regulatory protein